MKYAAHPLKVLLALLPVGNPFIVMTVCALDLQCILLPDIEYKGQFLLRMELPDSTPFELA